MMKKYVLLLLLIVPFHITATTRAIWITRWDYSTPADIKNIIQNADKLGFNTILFQVRGAGTVLYPSRFETWAKVFNEKDPGWDPLKFAIQAAHDHQIELHAWINVYTGWKGQHAPNHPEQLYHKHPSWFVVDKLGNPQVLNNNYLWLSPTHPDVKHHILNICRELLYFYDLDGIHLDYCRYPGPDFSYDDKSVRLFKSVYEDAPQNIMFSWNNWRQRAITELVTSIHNLIQDKKPSICLSAAVIGDPKRGETYFLQETDVWMKYGIIDAVYPMLYTQDMRSFKQLLRKYIKNRHHCDVNAGIYIYQPDTFRKQLEFAIQAGCQGTAVFSYSLLNPQHKINPLYATQMEFAGYEPSSQNSPDILQIKTIPEQIHNGESFRIAVKISPPDKDKRSEAQKVLLIYGHDWPPSSPRHTSMSRVSDSQQWFITDNFITLPESKQLKCRIGTFQNLESKSTHNLSKVWSIKAINTKLPETLKSKKKS